MQYTESNCSANCNKFPFGCLLTGAKKQRKSLNHKCLRLLNRMSIYRND